MKILILVLVVVLHSFVAADENTPLPFNTSNETLVNKLEWSGNLDVKYALLHSRQNSSIYKILNYQQQDTSSFLSQFRLEPYINTDYVARQTSFHLKSHGKFYSEEDSQLDLLELYGSVNPSFGSSLTGGKRAFSWGKGYAFNPVGYVNPLKDPENPELIQTGIISISGEYTKSITSDVLKTMALTAVIIPATATLNHSGEFDNTDLAVKSYFLLWDTDVDILWFASKVNARQIGLDFSRNIYENIEVHGEFSTFTHAQRNLVKSGTLGSDITSGSSYLFGMRYLNTLNTTLIAEYYHNGMGLTKSEFDTYRNYLDNVLASNNDQTILQTQRTVKTNFQKPVLMRDYLYLKITQPEPFNWVYFTPSLYSIINLLDKSFSLSAPLSYKPITNFEYVFTPTFFVGSNNSEFGEKQYGQRYEMWLRFFF
ncbi:MAG: hypothetical protein A2381_11555 [Bdellovibrionales bacterium RIFOXYB1_FULL_37_110]|nr:MAG: hypothetical protein A2417_11860 [Bdellovibrionales bacterium RIFOXYC1_FULL_37_79]OFZ57326.1 MAG: hypothetical protein A2381_11555 [Bdellovibrionales bacterium RIFOXYB1_FULL_37_110]OFZ62222.1 MAG: hypothetical protein A2577_14105 [Bdellovibrionales bacterium RIFOXYD1_FULL_36_51]